MSLCPNCGLQQPDGAAFCDNCGAPLEPVRPVAVAAPPPAQPAPVPAGGVVCPVCGAPAKAGEVYCDHCGAALASAAPTSPPAAPAASPAPPPAPAPAAPLTCSNCGAQLEPGSNFCDMCGAAVSAAAPAPAPAAPLPPTEIPLAAPPPPPVAAPPPVVAALSGRLIVQGSNAVLPFPPGRSEVIIGREDPVSGIFPEIDLVPHGGEEAGVSRRHARVFVQGSQLMIEDLNSTNYTYVNQQRLTPGQPYPLKDGDELRMGRLKLNYQAQG